MPPVDVMLKVVLAASGTTQAKLAARLQVGLNTIAKWKQGQPTKFGQAKRLQEIYLSEPLAETVETLGLWEPEGCSLALRAVKRRLRALNDDLAGRLGVSVSMVQQCCVRKANFGNRYVRKLADLCAEIGIGPEDIASERAERGVFNLQHLPVNRQHIFSAETPEADIREVLHTAKRDTAVEFQVLAEAAGVPRRSFYHFTRSGGVVPNAALQKKIFVCLEHFYRQANKPIPFVYDTEGRSV